MCANRMCYTCVEVVCCSLCLVLCCILCSVSCVLFLCSLVCSVLCTAYCRSLCLCSVFCYVPDIVFVLCPEYPDIVYFVFLCMCISVQVYDCMCVSCYLVLCAYVCGVRLRLPGNSIRYPPCWLPMRA